MSLLCVAIRHGDLQSVCYLLKEAHIPVPQEPSNTNPAILAAYYGHTSLVKELLDSVPGKQIRQLNIYGSELIFHFCHHGLIHLMI